MEAFDNVASRASKADDVSQYLTFTLAQEEYGIDILKVQEIRGYSPVTPVPNVPPYVKGVMNLRGTIIPVVDLRVRFGMAQAEYNRFNVIIVVSVGTKVIGLVVDTVSDVLRIAPGDIQAPPEFGDAATRAVNGIARSDEKVVLLLDIDRVLSIEAPALALMS